VGTRHHDHRRVAAVTGTITRRGLLAAGGAGLLATAGCGADAEPPPSDASLLGAVLRYERALVRAYEDVPGRLGRELGARAAGLESRLRQAGATTSPLATGEPLELERGCMTATLTAIGFVRSTAARDLAADVMTTSAQHAAILLERLGRDPLETPFPDGRHA
jgi:hypothetical protein